MEKVICCVHIIDHFVLRAQLDPGLLLTKLYTVSGDNTIQQ